MSLTSGYPEDLLVKIKCFMPASKTVENHLSWLANRDKISNENKRPKTLSNINIHMECTSTLMHNIYSTKKHI